MLRKNTKNVTKTDNRMKITITMK